MVTKMSSKDSNTKLAVVLIRGMIGTHPDVKKTLELLRLKRKHSCVIIENNEISKGMLQRVKDYVTYGPIDEATFKALIDKRGQAVSKEAKFDSAKISKEYFSGKIKLKEFEMHGLKPFFRLHPPKGGFERGGIKAPFTKGGVLGNRAENMKELISKML